MKRNPREKRPSDKAPRQKSFDARDRRLWTRLALALSHATSSLPWAWTSRRIGRRSNRGGDDVVLAVYPLRASLGWTCRLGAPPNKQHDADYCEQDGPDCPRCSHEIELVRRANIVKPFLQTEPAPCYRRWALVFQRLNSPGRAGRARGDETEFARMRAFALPWVGENGDGGAIPAAILILVERRFVIGLNRSRMWTFLAVFLFQSQIRLQVGAPPPK